MTALGLVAAAAMGGLAVAHVIWDHVKGSKTDDSFNGVLTFNDGDAAFPIEYTQRCFTFAESTKPAESAEWEGFPDVGGQIAFFRYAGCKGNSAEVSNKPKGSTSFQRTKLYHITISSVMVQRYSVYPVQGLVQVSKKERAMLRTATNASEGNSTIDYYPADANSSWWADVDEAGISPFTTGR
ncbi:hypothetical protein BBJ28_00017916 [Nothophytophthora sp. Chile5]|nr:hypothetical protein BBJ28_00017916 [Nothophytophthora sp. Chile5]